MKFGITKCPVLSLQRGVRKESRGIKLPSGESINESEETGYKYLGVLELGSILDEQTKESVRESYMNTDVVEI